LKTKKEREAAGGKAQVLKNILVVDDEVSVNNNIRKILGKNGFQVDQATSKEEAIEKINQLNYALVLLDLRMPGVSGLELLRIIAGAQPFARVIIITGYASIETAIESARIGAVDYLPKPFTPDELRNVAERAYAIAV
jgi:DNA-binding NtrC family response regulator